MSQLVHKYNCLIIDDEPPAIKVIREYVDELNSLNCIGEFTRATDAISLLNSSKVDLIFLDINMPGLSGIDFIKTLGNPPAIIFITAYRNFAIDAFDLQALDYLLKPISYERFLKAVNRFLSLKYSPEQNGLTNNKKESFIILKADKKQHKVFLDDIKWVESLDNYIKVHTRSATLICYMSLSSIEEQLPSASFIRIHRSYLINANAFRTFTTAFVEIDEEKIPIGRNYRDEVIKRITRISST